MEFQQLRLCMIHEAGIIKSYGSPRPMDASDGRRVTKKFHGIEVLVISDRQTRH